MQEQSYTAVHRQADDIGAGAADGTNQKASLSLNSVSTCFVKRFTGFDIRGKDGVAEVGKLHFSGSVKNFAAILLYTTESQSGDDLMLFSSKAAQDLQGMSGIIGLAEDTALKGDHCIRSDNPEPRISTGNKLGFFPSHTTGKGIRQFLITGCFINISGHDRKTEAEVAEQLLPPGRGRGKDQGFTACKHGKKKTTRPLRAGISVLLF